MSETEEYNYLTTGLNKFFKKETSDDVEQTEDISSSTIITLSGSSIASGISSSSDGGMSVNWNTGEVVFSDGARGRVYLGKLPGSSDYGIKIIDAEGNIIMTSGMELQTAGIGDSQVSNSKISGLVASKITTGTLTVAVDVGTAASGYTRIDGENNRLVVHDGTNPRIGIGEI